MGGARTTDRPWMPSGSPAPTTLSTYATGTVVPSAAMLVRIERTAELMAPEDAG
jgi:hypothetical protein